MNKSKLNLYTELLAISSILDTCARYVDDIGKQSTSEAYKQTLAALSKLADEINPYHEESTPNATTPTQNA